jgi:RimJ/RimL family protein N-acetyltransferase
MPSERHPTLIPLPDELRSARLVIRPYRPDDAAAVFAAIDESRTLLAPWLPWVHSHRDIGDTRDFCTRAAAGYLLRNNLDLGIFDARDGAYLGGIGLRPDWRARVFEIGYWVRGAATGHGYVSEAVRLLARLTFEALGANRLMIRCDARNERSRHVPERLGFPLEARLRNDGLDPAGQPRDTLVFAIIPEDYARLSSGWPQD